MSSTLRTEPAHCRTERGRHLRAKRIQEREQTASASDLILKLGQRPLFTTTPLQTTPRRVFVQGEEEESDR